MLAKPLPGSLIQDYAGAPAAWFPLLAAMRTFASDTGDVADLIGSTPAGARTGGCTWAAGLDGPCLSLDGTGGYLRFVGGAAMIRAGSLTVSLRLTPASTSNYYFLAVLGLGSSPNLEFRIEPGGVLALLSGGATKAASVSGAVVAGVPSACAFAYDAAASSFALYCGGRAVASAAGSATFTDPGRDLLVGTRGDVFSYFPGKVADLRVWNRALSAADVARDFALPWDRFRVR